MKELIVDPEEMKRLLSINHAIGGWEVALRLLKEVVSQELVPDDIDFFEGLMVGVCTLYGRPFKKAKGLKKLEEFESFSGSENERTLTEIHKAALDARDIVSAHQDVSKWDAEMKGREVGSTPSHLLVTVKPQMRISIDSGRLLPQENLHIRLPELITYQIRRGEHLLDGLVRQRLPSSLALPASFRLKTSTADR